MGVQKSLGLAIVGVLISGSLLLAQPATPPVKVASSGGVSPHETISAVIGGRNGDRVTIVYGRPFSKDPKTGTIRKIWGTLVPWGKVWRAGSDEATMLITQQPIVIGDLTVPAGAYTLDMLPDETGTSKLIINKALGQWGIPYTPDLEKQELARVDLKKDAIDKQVDEFTMAVQATATGGVIKLTWELTQYSVEFTVKKPGM
jgi:hypothetical protein